MADLLKKLKEKTVLLCDGAMGTLLLERGLKLGECLELTNLNNIVCLKDIANKYIQAGADIITTNSFGGSSLKLARYALDDKMEEINRKAVMAVKQVITGDTIIAASCGPTACTLKPYGETEPDMVYESFQKQISVLIDSGADAILIETMTDLTEATLAVKAAKSISSSIPVMATITFNKTDIGYRTIMGDTIESAAKTLEECGADIIGSNCGNGIEMMIEIGEQFKKHSSLPLIIQSNAGLPVIENGQAVYSESSIYMAEQTKKLLELGVNIIGGCCGTTPEHIALFRKEIDNYLNLKE